jgi:hypothetical protein
MADLFLGKLLGICPLTAVTACAGQGEEKLEGFSLCTPRPDPCSFHHRHALCRLGC